MSSKSVHYVAGVAVGAAVAYTAQGLFTSWQLALIVLGCLWGSSAPDWMEISGWTWWGRRYSLIPHREITHWLLGWVLCTAYVVMRARESGDFYWYIGMGFCIGALVHVLMDALTPMGVPLLLPFRTGRRGR